MTRFPAAGREIAIGRTYLRGMNARIILRCAHPAVAVACFLGFLVPAVAQPLPPSRPSAQSGETRPAPTQIAPPAQSGAAARAALSEPEALARVNEYLNSFATLQGNFTQLGADGKRYEGRLYLSRPGRLRFEYKPPATIEVIADGSSVAVRDRKLATQDIYSIGQTPLKFLVREKINLASDLKVTRISSSPEVIRVALEDKSTLGGTSKITLTYDPVANALRQWVVVDPQGYETTVSVFNLDTQRKPDPGLFKIDLQRMLDSGGNK